MSRIDELIAEHCPDGVPYVALSEVAEYSPTRVDAIALDGTNFVGVDNLVADKGGRIDANYLPNTTRLTAYEYGDILLGNIRPYLKKVWRATNSGGCSGDVLAVRIKQAARASLAPEFLYYLLSSDGFFAYNMQHAKGAKMPRGSKPAILKYVIPVPPLEVQRAIVEVLDTFSQLEAELEAELEARKQQYEHYQMRIIGSLALEKTDLVPLRSVGVWYGGGTPSKAISEFWANGTIPWISPKDMGSSYVTETEDRITPEAVRGSATKLIPSNSIALVTRSSILDHTLPIAFVPIPAALNQDMKAVVPREGIAARYLFHALRAMRSEILRKTRRTGGSVASLDSKKLWKFEVPVPSMERQREIEALFDKFDALVNDLSVGLPAELAARRQQYEHYRDRLLAFEELKAAA